MRTKMVAGNWKMNNSLQEGIDLITELLFLLNSRPTSIPVVIAPPFIHLTEAATLLQGNDSLHLAAQNCHQAGSGAYTGEVSTGMLSSVGVEYVILGHSERREYFNETDEVVTAKTLAALEAGLKVIWCCGEPQDIREAGTHEAYVKAQMEATVLQLSKDQLANIVIAYEPIWAIGTGLTASPEQAQEMHAFIRTTLAHTFGTEAAYNTTILYGGSCKPGNAPELFSQPDVDGGLIGGASLKAEDFTAIIHSF